MGRERWREPSSAELREAFATVHRVNVSKWLAGFGVYCWNCETWLADGLKTKAEAIAAAELHRSQTKERQP